MLNAYRRVLATPGARGFSAAGAVGRLPLSMAGLGIVLLMSERLDSYAQAGIVAAGYTLAAAACAPMQGRLADRFGQRPVLMTAGLLFATGIALLLAFSHAHVGIVTACAALAGMGAPQAGNMVRRRWTHVETDRTRLGTAFALEAVLDEAVFIIGPVLVTFLTLNVLDVSGLATAAVCALVGSWALAAQRSTEPPTSSRVDTASMPFTLGLLVPLVIAAMLLGVLFGSVEVLVVAFAKELGQDAWAGLVLAIWSVGSLAAGLFVGSLPAPEDPVRRLRITTTLLALLCLPLPFAPSLAWLTVAMLGMGLMVAPTLIGAVNLVELTMPRARLTEALTWTSTGLSVGVAPGAVAAGWVVDNVSASAGFYVPLLGAALTAVVARIVNPTARQLQRN